MNNSVIIQPCPEHGNTYAVTSIDASNSIVAHCTECKRQLSVSIAPEPQFRVINTEIVKPSSLNTAGLLSLISSLVGLIVWGLPLGITALVLGLFGLGHDKKGLAIAGVVIGVVDIIAVAAYMSL